MTIRAAVAWEAGKPLEIEKLPGFVDRYHEGRVKLDEMVTDHLHEGEVIRSVFLYE